MGGNEGQSFPDEMAGAFQFFIGQRQVKAQNNRFWVFVCQAKALCTELFFQRGRSKQVDFLRIAVLFEIEDGCLSRCKDLVSCDLHSHKAQLAYIMGPVLGGVVGYKNKALAKLFAGLYKRQRPGEELISKVKGSVQI